MQDMSMVSHMGALNIADWKALGESSLLQVQGG